MKKNYFIGMLIAAGLFSAVAVFAGNVGDRAGNGGDVVVCMKDGVQTAVLLDEYEASIKGYVIEPTPPEWSMVQNFNHIFEKLNLVDPIRATTVWSSPYADVPRMVMQEIEFPPADPTKSSFVRMTDNALVDVDDSKELELPTGCEKRQLIVQMNYCRDKLMPWDRFLTLSRPTWNLLNNKSKAMAVMHEIIYAEALCGGANDSRASRYLNAFLNSTLMENDAQSISWPWYVEMALKPTEIKNYTITNQKMDTWITVDLNRYYSYSGKDPSQIAYVSVIPWMEIYMPGLYLRVPDNRFMLFSNAMDERFGIDRAYYDFTRKNQPLRESYGFKLYADGTFKEGVIQKVRGEGSLTRSFHHMSLEGDEIYSQKNFTGSLEEGVEYVLAQRSEDGTVKVSTEYNSYKTDFPKSLPIIIKLHGKKKGLKAKSVSFDANGNLVSYEKF